jgi:protein tyrosine/serine phosphatase
MMNRKLLMRWSAALLALVFIVTGCATGPRGFPPVEGIANFDEVNQHLYRGAQPNRLGLQHLQQRGIRTVINLRATNDAWMAEREEAGVQGMAYFNVPMSGTQRPSTETVSIVLSIIEKSPSPVFVHCRYGCDRTGVIIACYRIQHEGWTSSKALNEARIYGMGRWEFSMKRFVKAFERRLEARPK